MAKFLAWSDLHSEFRTKTPLVLPQKIDEDIEAILLAGDVSNAMTHVEFAAGLYRKYGVPIIMVAGNHEYYGEVFETFQNKEAELLAKVRVTGADVRILNGTNTFVGETEIIGATLWTDFELEPGRSIFEQEYARLHFEDFKKILSGAGKLVPGQTALRHQDEKARIFDLLSRPRKAGGGRIVMSHHMPLREAIAREVFHEKGHAAFASNLWPEIKGRDFDCWLFGHTHFPFDEILSDGEREYRFLANPMGYPWERSRYDYGVTISV